MKKYILLLTLLACTAISSLAQAPDANGILYVKKGSTGTGNSWANALGELAEALKTATVLNLTTAGTVKQIWVAAGTYLPLYPANAVIYGTSTTTNRINAFVLVKDVQLYGGFAGTETVLSDRDSTRVTNATILSGDLGVVADSTDNACHVVIAANVMGTAAINSFVITGGVANGGSSSISVNGVSIAGNVGGGMANIGLSVAFNASPAIQNITLIRNAAVSFGAGLYNSYASPTVFNTVISNNFSGNAGAGVFNISATPVLNNVVISGNQASLGAGICNTVLSPRLINVSIIGNRATSRGGGMYNDGGSLNPVLTNVTISGNVAPGGNGGAIYNDASASSTIQNSIIYGNSSGIFPAAGTLKYSLVQGVAANTTDHVLDGTTVNPLFNNPSAATAPFTDGDYSLQAGSLVINSGSNTLYTGLSAATRDLAGNARVTEYGNGGSIDLGAYEYPVPVLRPDANGILYVKKGATGGGNNWANALGELADALKAAQTLGTVTQIWVAGGTYYPMYAADFASADNRDKAFVLVNNVKVYGGFAGTETTLTDRDLTLTGNKSILNGDLGTLNTATDNAYHVVVMVGTAGTAELNGFTVTAGYATRSGNLIVNGTAVIGSYGGGMQLVSASPVLANMEFLANTGASGGALALYAGASATIQNTVFKTNTATSGGAVYIYSNNTSVFDRVTFSGNNASANGGAIYITLNDAPVFKNVQITGNKAGGNGGAAFISNNTGYQVSFINSVLSGNSSANGVIYTQAASIVVQNSIIYGNSHGIISTGGSDPNTVVYSLVQGISADPANHIMDGTTNPLFVSADAYSNAPSIAGNYALQYFSPVINKGSNALAIGVDANSTDLAGNARVYQYAQSGAVDIGAFEYQGLAGQTITAADMVKTVGVADFEPGATASSGLTVNYVSADNTIAEAYQDAADGNKWKIRIKKAGIVNITASQPGDAYTDAATDTLFALTILGPDANGIIYVKKGATGAGNSWANAVGELAEALKAATLLNGATAGTVKQIWVAAGTYLPRYPANAVITGTATNTDRNNSFVLVKDIKLYGGFAGNETDTAGRNFTTNTTILSGDINATGTASDNTYRVVVAAGEMGDALISGFTISGGYCQVSGNVVINGVNTNIEYGAGITVRSATLLIEDVILTNNYDNNGAGAACYAGSGEVVANATFRRVNFLRNSALASGAGIYATYANVQIENTTGSFNVVSGGASSAGGMFALAQSATVNCRQSSFNDNKASTNGGAIVCTNNAAATFYKCAFLRDTCGQTGGAFYTGNSANVLFENCVIKGCVSNSYVAAGYVNSGTGKVTFINSQVTGNYNTNSSDFGIIRVGGGTLNIINTTIGGNNKSAIVNPGSTVNVFNSIIYGNGGGITGSYSALYSTIQGSVANTATHITNADPLFVSSNAFAAAPFTGGDYSVQSNSPAFNAGYDSIYHANDTTTTDIAGNARFSGAIDQGAYELQLSAQAITALADTAVVYGDVFTRTFIASSGLTVALASTDNNIAEVYQDAADGNAWKIKAKKAGTVNITMSQPGNASYVPAADVVFALTVDKAPLSITAKDTGFIYTGTAYNGGNGIVYSGFVNGDDATSALTGALTYSGTSQGAVNANTYVITPGGLSASNYDITYAGGALTIDKADLTVTASTAAKTYDGLAYSGGNGVTYSGFVNNEDSAAALTGTVTYSGTSQNAVNAGPYVITPGGLAAANYTLTYADGALTIGKSALTITASAATKTYDGLAYSGGNGVTYSGFVNNEDSTAALTGTVTYSGTSQNAVNVGPYVITPGGLAAANYTLTYGDGTLTIGKAALTVTASAATKTYDGLAYSGGNGITYTGFVNNEDSTAVLTGTVTYSGTSQNAINVGPYVIMPGGLSAVNYTITYADGTLTIGKAALTVTASAATKTYDGLAYSGGNGVMYSGFVNSETAATAVTGAVTYTGTSQNATNVGPYVITPGGLSAANYTLTYANGTLTIGKAALTVTASAATKTYDGLAYSGGNGVTYSGFVNSETATTAVTGTVTYAGTSQNATNVGPYVITPGGLSAANYTLTYANGTLTIGKAALTVAASAAAKTYDGLAYSGGNGVTYSGFLNSETAATAVTGAVTYSGTSQGAKNVGNTYVITPGGLIASNYTISYTNGTLIIGKAALTITAKDSTKTYDGLTYSGGHGVNYGGFVNGEDSTAALTGILTYTGTSQGVKNIGNAYVITPSGLTASNYTLSYTNGTLTIGKAALTVTAKDSTKTYDGIAYSGGHGVNYVGFVNNEDSTAALTGTLTYTGTAQGAKNVGNAYVITPGGLAASNYAISYTNGTLTIGKAALTVTAKDSAKAYDGLAYSGGHGVNYSGFVNGEDSTAALTGSLIYTGTSQGAKNVGNTYVITPGGLNASNYAISYTNGTLTIGKTALAVTAKDSTKTYDGLAYSGGHGVNYSGFVNGEDSTATLTGTVTYTGTSQGAKNVGNAYVITPGGLAASNYAISYANGTLTIGKAALMVTAKDSTKTYDGLAFNNGNGVNYSGFVNSEDSTVALTGSLVYTGTSQGAKNVGNTYIITPGGLAASNYTISYANGNLTIGKAALTVTAKDSTKTYDGLTYSGGHGVTYSGFVNGETTATAVTGTVTYGGTSQNAVNVGPYVITPGGLSAANYTLSYVDGTLTIGKAALTVTASAATKTYDGLAYSGGNGVTYSGFVNSETAATAVTGTVAYTGTSQGAKNVNTYVITPGGLAAINYALTYADGTLTIGKAVLTVTASAATKTYDGLAYSGGNGVTYNGFVNSETAATAVTGTVTYSGTSQSAKNVNTYVITPGGLSAANYTLSYVDGTLTIGRAALTVTASAASKTYDGLAYSGGNGVTYSGFVNSETAATAVTGTVTYSGTSQNAVNVGPYVITPGGLSAANYTLTYGDGTLTIGKAALTITASAASKTYDGLAYSGGNGVTYSGFVNGETAATAVTGTVIYSGTSQNAVNVGPYVITPGGLSAANYTLTYVDGTLTIGKAALTVTASAATKTYDGLAYSGGNGVTYSGFVNSETAATAVTGTVTYSGTSQGAKNVNTYVITPGGLSSANYTLTYADGALTIGKAALTVTASAATKTYDGIAYSGGNGVTYSGFVNSETAATAVTGTVTYSGTSQGAKNVNTYVITPGGLSAANYTLTYADGTLTIGKAALTVTASAATKTYDGIAYSGGNGVTYSGFVNSETAATAVTGTVTYSGTSQGAKNVNTYVITPGGLSSANYTLTYADGALTIGKAALTVTASAATKTYDGLAYSGGNGVTYSGFVNSETAATAVTGTVTYSGTSQGAKNVNTYVITPGGLSAANYTLTYADGTLTIGKAALTVTASAAAKTYDGLAYSGGNGITYSGFVNSETAATAVTGTVTYSGTSQGAKNVNTYVITPGGLSAVNYTITYADGALTIGKAALTVTASAATKTYDGLAYSGGNGVTYSGFVNSETAATAVTGTVTYSGTSQGAKNVNSYVITPGGLSAANYTITYANGTLTIVKAALTITAESKLRCYGFANPAFTYTYNGFVNGETTAVLSTPPTAVTAATVSSAAGPYSIVPSGASGANYTIAYNNGTLTVQALPVSTLSAAQGTILCGTAASLILDASGAYNFVWRLNNVILPGQVTGLLSVAAKGTYTAVATDVYGCTAPAVNSITFTQLLPPQPAFSFDSYCAGKQVSFTNQSVAGESGPVAYAWNNGNGASSTAFSPQFTYANPGNYTVALTVTPQACPSLAVTTSKTIAVEAALPGVKLQKALVPSDEPTVIQGRNLFTASYNWLPATGLSNTAIYNPLTTLQQDQAYTIRMTFPSGCITTDSLQAAVFVSSTILAANVFSPNGDGQNDQLVVNLRGVQHLSFFRVFNRDGKKIFETSDPAKGWDGRYNGELQPLATYIWTAEGVGIHGNTVRGEGSVTLLR
jgi:gliding motility-associated-like protein